MICNTLYACVHFIEIPQFQNGLSDSTVVSLRVIILNISASTYHISIMLLAVTILFNVSFMKCRTHLYVFYHNITQYTGLNSASWQVYLYNTTYVLFYTHSLKQENTDRYFSHDAWKCSSPTTNRNTWAIFSSE